MTPEQFTSEVATFFDQCMAIMRPKNQDYNPDKAVFLDLFQTAFDEGIQPDCVLRVLLQKHWTVIRGWTAGALVQSEHIESRLHDAANFIAFLQLMATPTVRDSIIADILRVKGSACACGCVGHNLSFNRVFVTMHAVSHVPWCEHGRMCRQLMRFVISSDSNHESWPMTLKVLDSFPTDLSRTGGTFLPDHSRLPTVTPKATPPTPDTK